MSGTTRCSYQYQGNELETRKDSKVGHENEASLINNIGEKADGNMISDEEFGETIRGVHINVIFIFPFIIRKPREQEIDIERVLEKLLKKRLAKAIEFPRKRNKRTLLKNIPDKNAGWVVVTGDKQSTAYAWAKRFKAVDEDLFHPTYLTGQRFGRAFLGDATLVVEWHQEGQIYDLRTKAHVFITFYRVGLGDVIIFLDGISLNVLKGESTDEISNRAIREFKRRVIDIEFLIRESCGKAPRKQIRIEPGRSSGIANLVNKNVFVSLSEFVYCVVRTLAKYRMASKEYISGSSARAIMDRLAKDAFTIVWIEGIPYLGRLDELPEKFIKDHEELILDLVACPWRYYKMGVYDYYRTRHINFYRREELKFLENTSARKDMLAFMSNSRLLILKVAVKGASPMPDYSRADRIARTLITRSLALMLRELLSILNEEVMEHGTTYGGVLPGSGYENLLRRVHHDLEELYNIRAIRYPIWRLVMLDTIDRLGVNELYQNLRDRLEVLDKFTEVASHRRLQLLFLILTFVTVFAPLFAASLLDTIKHYIISCIAITNTSLMIVVDYVAFFLTTMISLIASLPLAMFVIKIYDIIQGKAHT